MVLQIIVRIKVAIGGPQKSPGPQQDEPLQTIKLIVINLQVSLYRSSPNIANQ